eukprot:TRINITY_DN11010_c0_g1_i1.p1 TRINITY_DN11010_c0_g1~~TRINITY_DN11010_c0_g1_i1.p1  ORF type:complete len:321 (+),score=64.15 TRINITY_DN11010_c0_g1_i1:124-963(+)
MSTVGRMDSAFFVSRGELLSWLNSMFRLNMTKVEQCSNGAVYCQIIDACHPGAVAMKKVNWVAKADHESIPNFKILQQAFDRCGIQRHVEVDKLIRGKYQDNLEFLQWIKTYFDRTFPGGEYDAVARRFTEHPLEWARPPDDRPPTRSNRVGQESRPTSAASCAGNGSGARSGAVSGRSARDSTSGAGVAPGRRGGYPAQAVSLVSEAEHERLREEVVDLKITVDGLETERDFYFQKLRDIEILCQALEATPDPHMTVNKFVEDVQRILYARDDEDEAP